MMGVVCPSWAYCIPNFSCLTFLSPLPPPPHRSWDKLYAVMGGKLMGFYKDQKHAKSVSTPSHLSSSVLVRTVVPHLVLLKETSFLSSSPPLLNIVSLSFIRRTHRTTTVTSSPLTWPMVKPPLPRTTSRDHMCSGWSWLMEAITSSSAKMRWEREQIGVTLSSPSEVFLTDFYPILFYNTMGQFPLALEGSSIYFLVKLKSHRFGEDAN